MNYMDVKLVFYEMKITLKITDSNQDDEAKITRKISQHETTSSGRLSTTNFGNLCLQYKIMLNIYYYVRISIRKAISCNYVTRKCM